MIKGIGIDMVEVARMGDLLRRHTDLTRIFGDEELRELKLKDSVQSYAAAFCAKEAFFKAIGAGMRGFNLNDVQLLHQPNGRPYYSFSGDAKMVTLKEKLIFHVSITHTRGYAAAYAVAERID